MMGLEILLVLSTVTFYNFVKNIQVPFSPHFMALYIVSAEKNIGRLRQGIVLQPYERCKSNSFIVTGFAVI